MSQSIAKIAIPAPLYRLFDYRIPKPLQGQIRPGMRVEIPFGRQKKIGIVVELADSSEFESPKPITSSLDEEPLLPKPLMDLILWGSRHYIAPPGEAFRAVLPSPFWKTNKRQRQIKALKPPLKFHPKVITYTEAQRAAIDTIWKNMDSKYLPLTLERLSKNESLETGGASKPSDRLLDAAEGLRSRQDPSRDQNRQRSTKVYLLHGVTGSGKTEAYLELARRILQLPQDYPHFHSFSRQMTSLATGGASKPSDRLLDAAEGLRSRQDPSKDSVLFLVPEIALTPQLLGRCAAALPEPVGSYHSGMTARQRQDVWEACRAGELCVVVGTRSALFLPLQKLGLIIVDEEHDSSFKQEERFRYNARDLAIVRGHKEGAAVILGSATPSLETLQRCREGKYHYLQLPERAGIGKMPQIRFTDLSRNFRKTKELASLISDELAHEIDDVLQRGRQVILFLNRRGFSPVKLCQDCGETLQCPHCHISLTLHKRNTPTSPLMGEGRGGGGPAVTLPLPPKADPPLAETAFRQVRGERKLLCHYCLFEQKESPSCSACGSARVLWVGWGTERIEEDLKSQFPRARIARLDRDSTRRKGILEETLERMRRHEIDILVGTQMLAKGHDYANVTLVGILLAESSLNFPDFRAGERTFQLLTQVAGRAGRGEHPGKVIVQGFQPNHYVIQMALNHDYSGFADREMASRNFLNYPPFQRLVQIVFRSANKQNTTDAASKAFFILKRSLSHSAEILGPAPCPIEKLRGQYRWQIVIKTKNYSKTRKILQALLDADFTNILPSKVSVAIDVDPMNML